MDTADRTWRASDLARRWANACAWAMVGDVAVAFTYTADGLWHGLAANLTAGAAAFWAQYCFLFARRTRVTLTGDALVVVNALTAARTIALTEITGITGITESPNGLKIHRRGRAPVRAHAAHTPKAAIRAGTSTRSTRIAEAVLDAAQHRMEGR